MTKEYIEKLLEKVTEDLNITETQFDAAEAEYKNIGNWIDKNTPQYKIDIYPQGSFALGTVVKPIDREDEYDIDLVCEYQEEYGFEAEELKEYFPEFHPYEGQCRFRGCVHEKEPDCAVKQAGKAGLVSKQRYLSYLQLYKELKEKEKYRY